MIDYYEIKSGLKKLNGKLISSFNVLVPAKESISYLTTINGTQESIIRYYVVADNSSEQDIPCSHTLVWDNNYHKVIIEINSDDQTTGGDIARKTDIAD